MASDRLLELSMLAAYLALLLWIGLRSARRIKTSDDYTLAGRGVGWVIVLATTAVTMIGGGASVGMASQVFAVGIAAALVTCAWHLQLIFTGLFVAPKLRGLNLITVGDYFHLKFGPLARELAVINCMIFLVGVLAAQLAAIGTVTNTILGIPYGTGLLIGAAVTIFYATVGGVRAVVNTDVLQFVILVAGFGVASSLLLVQHGGFEAMLAAADPGQAGVTSHWSTTRLLSLFFAFLLGETFAPTYTVRCFIARNREHARWGVAGAGVFLLLFLPIATFILGTSAQIDPDVQTAVSSEQNRILQAAIATGQEPRPDAALIQARQIVFPALVRSTFHPAFAGIMIAAIIAAVMSSADSCLSCFSTVIMEDTYRRHINEKASDHQLLRVAQVTTLVAGIMAVACAWFFSNIAEILVFVYDFWAPTMILPFLVAVFWYSPNRIHAVVVSMVVGALATIWWRFGLGSPWDVGPASFGVVAASVAFAVAVPLTRHLPARGLFKPSTREDFR
ncbi:MAG: sodium:solute symporter family protein [Acidobacteriia bacterium]|nr:sodium:solute symporter family protein [Terriglobia bacterium]MYK11802.1 sodium:solute symporter family protein [Terriglobia bacterium]